MYTIKETIDNKITGLYYGNRLILPFKANFLKIILEADIITDFSPAAGKIFFNETDSYTDIYFNGVEDLQDKISKYESIKFIVSEKNTDIFNFKNHIKLSVYLEEKHTLKIEKTDDDVLFIE
jgi:hypothetical protein